MRPFIMQRFIQSFFVVALFLLLLAACAPQATEPESSGAAQPDSGPVAESGFPVTLTDASGVEHRLEEPPQRLVSLAPSITENVFALKAGDRLVGVTDWDNYPEEVANIERIGGLEPNIEKILSLEPDLVLAHASVNDNAVQPLRDVGLSVLVLPEAQSFDGTYAVLRMLGQALGAQEQAEEVIQQMEAKKADIVAKVADIPETEKVRVWVEVSPDLYTAGSGTFIDDLIRLAGGINVAAEVEGWAQLSEEQVIAAQPDVIITTYGYYTEEPPAKMIASRKSWADIPAVRDGRIYDVDSDIISRPGPRLAEGLLQVAASLYPDRFQ